MKKLLLSCLLLTSIIALFGFAGAFRVVLDEREANQIWRQLNEVSIIIDNADLTNHGNVKYVLKKVDSVRQVIANNIDTTKIN